MDMTKTIKQTHMEEEDVVDAVILAPTPHMLPVVPKLLLLSFPIETWNLLGKLR